MKRLLIVMLAVFLMAGTGFAGTITFPDQDVHAYRLTIYRDHFTIWDYGCCSELPLSDGTNYWIQTGPTRNQKEMATRNAWLAILLQAQSTEKPVLVEYADTDSDGQLYGIGGLGIGNIISVSTIPKLFCGK